MKEDIKLEKYKSKSIIEAVKYEEGMEDGFDIRYCSQQDMDDYKAGLVESVSTWGIPSLDGTETVEIKVPYITVNEESSNGEIYTGNILLGNGYYLIKNEFGEYIGLTEEEFNELYEKL